MEGFRGISLAAARVNARMTQEEAAKGLKVSRLTILNWEQGKTSPSFADLAALSNLYRIPVDLLFLPETLAKS